MNRFVAVVGLLALAAWSQETGPIPRYSVVEFSFTGPVQGPTDRPAETISFSTEWRHESGSPTIKIHGFWDGDGAGGTRGNVFKVRFCPTKVGKWTLASTVSNSTELNGERVGTIVNCVESTNHGFWVSDGIWFGRSDGTHQYMVGNVHYCVITTDHALEDLRKNRAYYNKLRFFLALHPSCPMDRKPFFTSTGQPSNAGADSKRPNPAYYRRADAVVSEAARDDFIIDMYLEGQQSAIVNDSYLRYVAARFGSFPNVWLQLQVEWNEYMSTTQVKSIGTKLRSYLPYPTPLSTISAHNWSSGLNGPWCTHANIQGKVFGLKPSADAIVANRQTAGGIITNNDDNGPDFQGFGGTTRDMEIERILGCFLGAGYSGTGYKTATKVGQYWTGNFDPAIHSCSAHLKYLRSVIDSNVYFWEMTPGKGAFSNAAGFAWIGWEGKQYAIGSNVKRTGVKLKLPTGRWRVQQFDMVSMKGTALGEVIGPSDYAFTTPPSVAGLTLFTSRDVTATVAEKLADRALPDNIQAGSRGVRVVNVSGRTVWRGDAVGRNGLPIGRGVYLVQCGGRQGHGARLVPRLELPRAHLKKGLLFP